VIAALLVVFFVPQSFNVYFSGGQNAMNRHGHSVFRSIHFEVAGSSSRLPKFLRDDQAGAALTYSAVRQARSWFGYADGDPDDNVRAESLYLFVRRERRGFFADIGTGPMWSNRRIPAATSRLNFNSQVSLGIILFSRVRLGYRFSHISNGGLAGRNPGLNVHSVLIGLRAKRLR
jgi:hypothetical protein